MSRRTTLLPAVCLLTLVLQVVCPRIGRGEAEPEEAQPAETIVWRHDLPAAFEEAAAENKVLLICINAKNAIGEREEPAAKGLREVVYLDPTVVKKSRSFVCVFLTAEGSSDDYGELRYRLGIDGFIVSPQHIFAHPKQKPGAKPLVREEYWPYGDGERAVKALLGLMDEALAAYRAVQERTGTSDPEAEALADSIAPASGPERAAWIGKLVHLIQREDKILRRRALRTLIEQDKEEDCIAPLVPLLATFHEEKRVDALIDVVRRLGVPGLEAATPVLHELLEHEDASVRGHVAVTLEYIGSAASTQPLLERLKGEKEVVLANHMARALGRCGAGDAAVRKRLLRLAQPGKDTDFGSFGAVIGLAYFEGDAKLARAVERKIPKLGSPFKLGKNTHTFLRAALLWCLSEIRDPKTAPFLRRRVVAPLEKETSPWKSSLIKYCEAIARRCEGDDAAQKDVDKGIEAFLWADEAGGLADTFRRGRNMERFVPKGEWGNRPEGEDE